MPKLDLDDLKRNFDKDYTSGETTREEAANDLVFYFLTQWDDSLLEDSQLAYRGQFDVLKKAARKIITDLDENPIQVDFEPKDETREDSAEVLDGLYRADDNNNLSIESYENAKQEAIVCGVGGWELFTEYASMRSDNKNQIIKRRPLFEANNTVYWDANAKLLDKSDARRCTILTSYSPDGYKTLVHDMTGEKIDQINPSTFKHPEQSYTFPWLAGEGEKFYVGTAYYLDKVKTKVLTMVDPFGQSSELVEEDLADVMDEMLDGGYEIQAEKTIERWRVTKYIMSGERILSESVIAGENIPVVPVYGEHAIIEGEEHYEGVTRLAKDPQRLRNFQLSYLADIVSRSPRNKPIYWPEQVAGYEDMYSENGADDNYPYKLMNRYDANGKELPIGAVGETPGQKIPQALIASIALSKEAVADVANPGVPQDVADVDLSGKAARILQAQLEVQSVVYQKHYKHAKRRDAEIYASMASEIHDVPKKVKIGLPDGTTREAYIMQQVIDRQTGDVVTLNDLRNAEFDVYSKIGPSYSSQKEQTVERLTEEQNGLDPADPMRKIISLKKLQLMDGVDFDDIRDYVNGQLIVMGIKKPRTPEEQQILQQAQSQPPEPDANMVLAMAEMEKAKADQGKVQLEYQKLNSNSQNEGMKRMTDQFEALTDRMNTMINAQETGSKITNTDADTAGKELDNASKIIKLQIPIADKSDDELFEQIAMG